MMPEMNKLVVPENEHLPDEYKKRLEEKLREPDENSEED